MSSDPDSSGGETSDFSDFLADYFIECDEHLTTARQCVLTLEPLLGQAAIDRGVLDELFRSFHSLKGLSAMVGFHEAEQLAHHLETFLSAVRKNQVRLNVVGLETLVSSVATLEEIIAARRDAAVVPDFSPLLSQVASLLPVRVEPTPGSPPQTSGRSPASTLASKESVIEQKVRAGARVWLVRFEPSPALAKQGIDVNYVRQKIQELGELIHSEPIIAAGGRIAFSFALASHDDRPLTELHGEGLTCTPLPASEIPQETVADHPSVAADSELSTHLVPANLVRVDLSRLDDLMRLVGELVLSRARLEDNLRRLKTVIPGGDLRILEETNSAIERQLRDLREGVMRVRMVPIREVFARMRFVVRDLIRELGKQATLQFTGEDTQIDKYVVERIMDPLLHLVRNAVVHGLEPVEQRLAAGKSAVGQIHLRARTTGENVIIEVEDDGQGIDAETVQARARARGYAAALQSSDSSPVLDILCMPGFSTQEHPDRASGRGVGMDVVRRVVEEMGGTLSMQTRVGAGTRFTVQLPLTLAITEALVVKIGDQRFAIPQVAVREVLYSEASQATFLENNELLHYHGGVLPLFRLARWFGITAETSDQFYALVIGEGVHAVGVVVDRVLTLREVVVRPLTDRLVKVAGVAGATELGDGKVVLILDTANLFRIARGQSVASHSIPQNPLRPATHFHS